MRKLMNTQNSSRQKGFTLLELTVASALGLIVILAMTSLFKAGMDTTFTVTQRAETQQNMRAAIELISKDLGMAGAGLPSGGLQLVTGAGTTNSLFACNQTGTCYVPNDTYLPNQGSTNYMFPIIPGYSTGVQSSAVIAAAPGAINDSVTSIYCDYNFPLTNFSFTFNNDNQAVATVLSGAVQPNNVESPGGLNKFGGDLLLFIATSAGNGTGNQGNSAIQSAQAVGEITSIQNNGPWTINFAANDALNFNQNGNNSDGTPWTGSLRSVRQAAGSGNQISVCRLNVVTYFLQVPTGSTTVQNPRLMRQMDGFDAVPVADNIINLQFTYDIINTQVTPNTINANLKDPVGGGLSPALIQKINMFVMGESLTSGGKKSQSMYLASSVSTRNTSFCNVYSSATSACQ